MADRVMSSSLECGSVPLPLAGALVLLCSIDYAFSLDFDGGVHVRIERQFLLRTGGREHRIDLEGPPEGMGPALVLARATASSGEAFRDGRLHLVFDGGTTVDVPGGEQYEAWSLTAESGLRLVSLPGGDLAVWWPQQEASDGS